ncbi:MAG: YceI family protein [Deltaproteobacteria bacterium]|nr:YceI family protein [Deltaproteobacteria bacterium]
MRGELTGFSLTHGQVFVTARSSIHDTKTKYPTMEGQIRVNVDEASDSPSAEIRVDMRDFDAGDWLKNRKLRSDLQPEKHPTALFRLTALEGVTPRQDGKLEATAVGILSWRGREVPIRARGHGRIERQSIEAQAEFELDVRTLGVEPPKLLMFKVESTVLVQVELRARAQ